MFKRYALPEALKQLSKNTKDSSLYYARDNHHKPIFLNVYKRFVRLTKLINYSKTNMKNDYRVRLNYRYYLRHKFRYENYPLKRSKVLDTTYTDERLNKEFDQEKKIDANVLINTYYFVFKGIRYNMVHCNVNHCGDAIITDSPSSNNTNNNNNNNNNIATISNESDSNAYEYEGKEDDLICKQIMKNLLNMQYEKFKLHNSLHNGLNDKSNANETNSPTFYNKDLKLLENQTKYWNILYCDYSYLQMKNYCTKNLLGQDHKVKTEKNSRKDYKADQFTLKLLNISKFERDLVYLNEMLHTQL